MILKKSYIFLLISRIIIEPSFYLYHAILFVMYFRYHILLRFSSGYKAKCLFAVLLLGVVVFRRRNDSWHEKELDDIRENIIAYEDEGGGEGDAGYDLHVLRQMYEGPHCSRNGFMHPPPPGK